MSIVLMKIQRALYASGKKSGVRYDDGDEGYYYKYENGTWKMDGTEKILTEDCKVLIEPHARNKWYD